MARISDYTIDEVMTHKYMGVYRSTFDKYECQIQRGANHADR